MISYDYRFIFVHNSRTGGSGLERLAGMPETSDPRTAGTGNTDFSGKHRMFADFYQCYPKEFFRFFKFTIIRNPYDRMVSAWLWRCTIVKDHDCSLKEFVSKKPKRWSYQTRLKLDHLDFAASIVMFDYVARFETLHENIKFICNTVGLDYSKYKHYNKTQHGPYWKYYDDETIELVTNRFKEDIEYFGYRFGA